MVKFLIVTFVIATLALVVLMFSSFRKRLALAFKLIVAVYVISALSRLVTDGSNQPALTALAMSLVGFGVLWGILWLYSTWTLSRRQRNAAASSTAGQGSALPEPRKR